MKKINGIVYDGSVESVFDFVKANLDTTTIKGALAYKINGHIFDLRDPLSISLNSALNLDHENNILEFVYSDSADGLDILRHDTAHILAQAIKEIYRDKCQITIGPNVENGFYYDIDLSEPLQENDLAKIEEKMQKIIKEDYKISKEIWKSSDAIQYFQKIGENFKAEIIQDLGVDSVSVYKQADFTDLCRGPHAMSTGVKKYFKLTHVSGAYWRGDAKNKQLQRVYGTCWATKEELDQYLERMEKIKQIDHRFLGKKLDLFHMQQESPGCIFWHERGWTLYKTIENYIRNKIKDTYREVHTPQLIDRKLWELSGHWSHFKENMFCFENEDTALALKPMNCPAHVQIFKSDVRSYRDLPYRFFEFGCCHRNESSGSMHGIMRVRQFVQDDGHIFCRESDIVNETQAFCSMLKEIYADFGFNDIKVKFSDRPENRFGSDEVWDRAERLLMEGAKSAGLEMEMNHGEGAFYGPKLEFVVKDAVGRDWQCGTLQLDYLMPERLGAKYINENNEHVHPIMIHRAILGSLQRFIGILIENYEGKFPLWLAPTQVTILTLSQSDEILAYSEKLMTEMKNAGIRVILDDRSEKLQYKIQDTISNSKIPCLCVVGAKEIESDSVSLRILNDTKTIKREELMKVLAEYNEPRKNIYNYI
jgi:threonyl-tRNA synthetase